MLWLAGVVVVTQVREVMQEPLGQALLGRYNRTVNMGMWVRPQKRLERLVAALFSAVVDWGDEGRAVSVQEMVLGAVAEEERALRQVVRAVATEEPASS